LLPAFSAALILFISSFRKFHFAFISLPVLKNYPFTITDYTGLLIQHKQRSGDGAH
jgi:hypothetical protein